MFKNTVYILILLSSFIFSSETFNLKDGSSIIGERITEDELTITVKTSYGEIIVKKEDLFGAFSGDLVL